LSDFALLFSIRIPRKKFVMEETAKSKKPLIVGLVLLLIFAAAYIFVLTKYKSEGENRAAFLEADTQKAGENRIDVSGRIVTADVLKGDVVVRLEFSPKGSFLSRTAPRSRAISSFTSPRRPARTCMNSKRGNG